jgi:hypothetical protein
MAHRTIQTSDVLGAFPAVSAGSHWGETVVPLSTVRRIATAFGATLVLVVGLSTATAFAATPPGGPIDLADMQVTVTYGQTTYKTDDTFTATLTVTNNSDVDAVGVRAFSFACVSDVFSWPNGFDTGATIPAHSSLTAQVTGGNPTSDGLAGTVTCAVSVQANNMAGVVNASATATVTQAFGDYHGILYVDRNHDGTFEPGEGVGGITVTYIRRQDPFEVRTTVTTGPDGRFALIHVPTSAYDLLFSSRSGWVVGSPESFNLRTVTVTETPLTEAIPLTRPLSDRLHATVGFDQATYQPGDTVHVTVTLRNSGTTPIAGVVADCNRVGDPNSLEPGTGWGELDINGPGATIPAGQTVTFHVALPLPDFSQQMGYVSAACQFGPEPDQSPQQGFPGTPAFANVPGDNAPELVQIVQSDDTPVPNVRVRILNFVTHDVVATGVTDGNGEIALPNLVANQYLVHVSGPWFFKAPSSNYLQAISPGSVDQPRTFTVTARPQG